ncbi:MAG: hypothetical protein NTV80_04840, partial [Verrucomicrobia bacterium]|nr:hypothetical protein [Verrucomicrobiota bacterium]
MLLRTHLVLAAFVVILTSLVIPLNAHAEAPRIAVLPTFSDFEGSNTPWRRALSGFDARLQAELISAWDTEVLSRSGLSAIVFEQKLRQAKGKEFFQVLPAGVLLMSVFDFQRKQLRVHVCPVKSEMKLGVPKVFAAKMPAKLSEDLPHEVALFIASELGLAARVKDAAVSNAVPVAAGLRCAVLDPVCEVGRQDELPRIAPVIRAALEQILASKETGLELLERSGMASLIEERTLS